MAKKTTYAGIPAKHRARIKKIIDTGAWFLMDGHPKTPQKIWAGLQKMSLERAREERQAAARMQRARDEGTRENAMDALVPSVSKLASARDILTCIVENREKPYLDNETLAEGARLMIVDAATKLERALRDLKLISKNEYGFFVEDEPEEVTQQ